MSILETFSVDGFNSVNQTFSGGSNDNKLAFYQIYLIRRLLELSGWTMIKKTVASGDLYMPGWFVSYKPTNFAEIFPDTGISKKYNTRDDQCGCAEAPFTVFHGAFDGNPAQSWNVSDFTDFGVISSGCHLQCRNGCWLSGTCGCGHSCCHEDDDCVVTVDTTSPGCDSSGNFCNGHFTGSFESLAAAITGGVSGSPYYTGKTNKDGTTIHITANFGGPEWNAPYFKTEIGVGLDLNGGPAGAIFGGGYLMKSGVNPTTGEAYLVEITQTLKGQIQFRIGSATFLLRIGTGLGLPHIPVYKMIANPYQFIIVDIANTLELDQVFSLGGNSIFVTSPIVQPSKGPTSCIIAIGPGMLLNKTTWEGFTSAFFINGDEFISSADALRDPGVSYRNYSFANSLKTVNNKEILTNAWLFAPKNKGSEAAIVGKIWGGMCVSDVGPQNAEVLFNGRIMHQVCRQTSPVVNSLWLDGGTEVNIAWPE